MITKEGYTEIVNSMTCWAWVLVVGNGRNHIRYNENDYVLSTSRHGSEKTKFKVVMTKERSINFVTPGAGVLMLRCGHISHYIEYDLSSTLTINIQHINCYYIKGF